MSHPRRPIPRGALLTAVVLAAVLAGCANTGVEPSLPPSSASPLVPAAAQAASSDPAPLEARLIAIDGAVDRWRAASDLAGARRGAEEARNLVLGPAGPGYGDADGDGVVSGASDIGLLPGLGGEPGLATAEAGACVVRDVLGGDWGDPARRWAILDAAINSWSESNNTFPSLASHPQRIVGWATLALEAPDLATALEYGGHAHLHIDVALRATGACDG